MADCGFHIQKNLLLHFCNLQIPPGARTKSHMAKKRGRKDKRNCKFTINRINRIAINRLKNYRFLKRLLPITMMQYVDEIVLVCAALCNIKIC